MRLKLRQGVDISAKKKHEAPKLTQRFEKYALDWHAKRRAGWSERHTEHVIESLKNHAFPMLGDLHPASITPTMVLTCIQQLELHGKHETAKRVHQRIRAVFSYCIALGVCERNPAIDIADALETRPAQKNYAALPLNMLHDFLNNLELLNANLQLKSCRFRRNLC